MALAEEDMWDSAQEKALLDILHASLRKLLDKEEAALSRGGTRKLRDRWDDRVERIRRALMHTKTRILARKVIAELLAEAGGSKALTEQSGTVWGYLNDPYDWQKARDLALLALVTFTDGRLA